MPIYKIRGIDVDFPFEAYDCQVVYMDKVIRSLQEGCNALLESPTGTGKTLCLLCATLAWRKSFGEFLTSANEDRGGSQHSDSQLGSDFPVIIYTSRTHSQLKQVIRELKTSNYRPKMTVLGSREQMCIHDEVQLLRGKAQNKACQFVCKKRRCRHHSRVNGYMKNHNMGNEPFDIEDLVKVGRNKGPCPYYVSRDLHKSVDILFAPYNYLIDSGNRRSLSGIPWSKAVLVFDEAHNLESLCADAASLDLPSAHLTACISEAKQCIELCIEKRAIENSTNGEHDPDHYAILKALLMKLEKRVTEFVIESRELGFTRPGHYIYEFLSDLNITVETSNMLIGSIESAALLLEDGNSTENGKPVEKKGTVCRLESIKDFLNIIFRDGGKAHAKYYCFHVQESQSNILDPMRGRSSRTLSWWCFNPGLAMEEFSKLGIRSIILTSGTLSPLDSFALELNLDFPIRLENPHVISPDQIWVGVVPSGPSGYPFNSSYRSRDSVEYKQELGNAMVNFARIVPDGLLVFFPSYYLMDQCIDCWKNMSHASSSDCNTIWERICKNKQPVIEPKQSALFQHAIEDFEAKLHDNSTTGAIFFAVCRGKVSEGLDFADRTGRAVVITGMPFSTKSDPKVRLKREYLDQQALPCQKNSKVLTGEEWYFQQASRAVNQAVGRVIRHRNDYGAIIFCDERFMQQNYQCQMSYWLRPHVKCYPKFGDIVFTLTRFFRDKGKCTSSKPKPSSSLSVDQVGLHQDKSLPSESPTRLNSLAEHFSENPPSSALSNARGNTYDLLGQIVPANRATLSAKRKYHFASRHSTDQFHFQNSLRTNEIRTKKTQYKDNEVIDLDSDPSHSVQQRPEDVLACSIKKSKLLETGYVASDSETDGIVELHDVDSRHVPQGAHISNGLETIRKLKLPVSVCGDPEFGSTEKVGTRRLNDGSMMMSELGAEKTACEQKPGSKEQFQCTSIPCRNEETKGSAFLMQVQEKLTVEEYRDFVGFMKALKSKTMKIAHVLESIARLFSSPERFSLLKRFKDFVPSQYRPIYEQHILAHGAADSAPCVLPE